MLSLTLRIKCMYFLFAVQKPDKSTHFKHVGVPLHLCKFFSFKLLITRNRNQYFSFSKTASAVLIE